MDGKKPPKSFVALNIRDIKCICVCCRKAIPLEEIEVHDKVDGSSSSSAAGLKLFFGCFKKQSNQDEYCDS